MAMVEKVTLSVYDTLPVSEIAGWLAGWWGGAMLD